MSLEALFTESSLAIGGLQITLTELSYQVSSFTALDKQEILAKIEKITSNCERLDILVNKQHPSKRNSAKVRVDQLKHDLQMLESAFSGIQTRYREWKTQEENREKLLQTRFTTNALSVSACNGSQTDTSILIDLALEHTEALNRSHRHVDDLLDQGKMMLEGLREQRLTIKGIQKKLLDVASTLGMSGTVMRLIERQSNEDKLILIGGIGITCLTMYLVVAFGVV